jgi:hypothetical protein
MDKIERWAAANKDIFRVCRDFDVVYPCSSSYEPLGRRCEERHTFNSINDLRLLVDAQIKGTLIEIDPHFKH